MKRDLSCAANRVAQAFATVAIAVYFISGLAYLYWSVSVFYADLWLFNRRGLTLCSPRFALPGWNVRSPVSCSGSFVGRVLFRAEKIGGHIVIRSVNVPTLGGRTLQLVQSQSGERTL